MEQTTLPVTTANPINDAAFGDLIELPRLYSQSLSTVNGAKAYTDSLLKPLEGIDITSVDAIEMEKIMEPIRENRVFLADAETEIYDMRIPHTRKIDDVKGLYIGLEKQLQAQAARCANMDKAWETEKVRRARDNADAADKKIRKAQEQASIVQAVTLKINSDFSTKLIETLTAMSMAYHKKKADELEVYSLDLSEWAPELDDEIYNPFVDSVSVGGVHHTAPEIKTLIIETADKLRDNLNVAWTSKIVAERDRLILLIPSRIIELQTVAPEVAAQRVELAHNEILAGIIKDAQANAEIVLQEADNAKFGAVLDNMPTPAAVPVRKGVKSLLKYTITAHTAFPPIIAHWVKHNLGLLTLDEAIKKLSFMITAANEDLNKKDDRVTLVAPGLSTVEEINVRKNRKNANA